MEIKLSTKERFLKWWHIEGKIEIVGAIIALIVIVTFWNNNLVQGIVLVAGALCGYGKIFFKKEQWAFLLLISTYLLAQGITTILAYMRS